MTSLPLKADPYPLPMTHDQTLIYTIKGVIASLSAAEQEACLELADHMRRQISAAGNSVGTLALALVGAESQADADS